jgi:hypothetical protein
MARAKKSSTPPATQSEADDDKSAGLRIFAKWKANREAGNTPDGVDCGPFDIPSEWLAGRTPAEWAADWQAEEAELKRQRAVIERAIAIRDNLIPPPWVDNPKPKPKKERAKPATESAIAALLALYPGGKAPAGPLITEITREVHKWCKANGRRKLPGRDVVGDVVKEFGRQ